MSKKKKKPKYWSKWESQTGTSSKWGGKWDSVTNSWIECHFPKWVKVGDYRVYICGKYDLTDGRVTDTIKALDVFIGLDSLWGNLQTHSTDNKVVQSLYNKLQGRFTNLYVHNILDNSIDPRLGNEVINLLQSGLKIGFGCIGGHGRTGWLLGYLLRHFEGLEGQQLIYAIKTRLCKEALEGKTQFENLGLGDFYSPPLWQTHKLKGTGEGGYTSYEPSSATSKKNVSRFTDGITTLVSCPVCLGKKETFDEKCQNCDGVGYVEETEQYKIENSKHYEDEYNKLPIVERG